MATGITPVQDQALEEELTRIGLHKGYVAFIFFFVCLPGLFNTWHTANYNFWGSSTDFYCEIPELASTGWTHDQIREISAPPVPKDSASRGTCEYYALDYKTLAGKTFEQAKTDAQKEKETADKKSCSESEVVYVGTTANITGVVEEWNLVCGQSMMKAWTQNSVVIGKFLGAFLFGFVADKFGRLLTIQFSIIMYFIFGIVNYFAPEYYFFCFCRVMLGMAGSGTFNTGITLLMEICDTKYRSLLGVLYNIPYSLGMLTLSLIAMLCHTWKDVILYMALPMYTMVFALLFLPESPRWAIQRGLAHRAWKTVKTANRIMHCCCCTPIPEVTQNRIRDAPKVRPPKVRGPEIPVKERFSNKLRESLVVFTKKELLFRLLICWLMWPAAAFTYYVLNISADNLGVDLYTYIMLSAIPEAIAYVFPIPMIQYMGRRLTTALLFLICGSTLFFIVFVPQDEIVVILILSMVARLCAAGVFGVVILYTSELFPTEARSTAIGTSATFSHLSGVIAATVVDELGKIAWYFPTCLTALLLWAACILSLLLPETNGRKAPDSYEEMMQGDQFVSLKNVFRCFSEFK